MLICRQQMCSFGGHVHHHVSAAHHFRTVSLSVYKITSSVLENR